MFIRLSAAAAASFGIAAVFSACGGGSVPPPSPQEVSEQPVASVTQPSGELPPPASPQDEVQRHVASLTLLAGHLGGEGNVDGELSSARLDTPPALAVDAGGNAFTYKSGFGADYIRKIAPDGSILTLGGSHAPEYINVVEGPLSAAQFDNLGDIALAKDGTLYVTDVHGLHRITPGGVSSRIAGVGISMVDNLAVALDSAGTPIIAERSYGRLYKVPADNQRPLELTAPASMGQIIDIGVDAQDSIYILSGFADPNSGLARATIKLRRLAVDGKFTEVAGAQGEFKVANSLAVDGDGVVWVADGASIRRVTPAGAVTTLALPFQASAIAVFGNSLVVGGNATLWRVDKSTGEAVRVTGAPAEVARTDGVGAAARFDSAGPLVQGLDGSIVMPVLDKNGLALRRITLNGAVSTMTIDGFVFDAPQFAPPPALAGLAIDHNGTRYAISQGASQYLGEGVSRNYGGAAVYKLNASGQLLPWAGNGEIGNADGAGTAARLGHYLVGPVFAADGTMLIGDGPALKKISPDSLVTTLTAAACPRTDPYPVQVNGLAIDGADTIVACSDYTLRRVSPTGTVTLVAGSSANSRRPLESLDGSGNAAVFAGWTGRVAMAVGAEGNLYVADGPTIRRVTQQGMVTTVAGVEGQVGNRLGPLPGSLYPVTGLALLPDGSIAVSSGAAVLRLTTP